MLSQNESAIAANPRNPDNLVAVFQGRLAPGDPRSCFFAFTIDRGKTWQVGGRAPLEGPGDFCADPAVAADDAGNFYFSYIDLRGSGQFFSELDVLVAKSVDGGMTFPSFSIAVDNDPSTNHSPFPDNDFIGADAHPGSPFHGTIYVAYTDLSDQKGDEVAIAISRDGGLTWAPPQIIGPTHGNEPGILRTGALPVVAPDGIVYTFWAESTFTTGPLAIRWTKSADGGVTDAGLLVLTYPTAAVAPDGTVYVAWSDFSGSSCVVTGSELPACTNSDVRLSVSRNGGATWTAPVKVSHETNATDQFFPWIASHPDGRLSLVWLDRRLDPDNVNYDAFYTSTFDGSIFQPDLRVSSSSSLLGAQGLIGDCIGLAATPTAVLPAWCDNRFANPDIFSSVGKLP
jgi:hypothetical protein